MNEALYSMSVQTETLQSQQKEIRPPLSGTVVLGEASESDEELVNFPPNALPSLQGMLFVYVLW